MSDLVYKGTVSRMSTKLWLKVAIIDAAQIFFAKSSLLTSVTEAGVTKLSRFSAILNFNTSLANKLGSSYVIFFK